MKNNDTVFISYSWDNQQLKDWVRNLSDNLISNGINVELDQYDVIPGQSLTGFMEKSINGSDKIIVVLTPNYRSKSIERKGGVGYEQQIISGEIMQGIDRGKFIPIVRLGSFDQGDECAIPPHFLGIYTLDFRDDNNFRESFEALLRTIYKAPKHNKPTLGGKPTFLEEGKIDETYNISLNENFICTQPEPIIRDIIAEIADARKFKINYKVDFQIKGITDLLSEFVDLKKKENISIEEIERKHMLRNRLNNSFI